MREKKLALKIFCVETPLVTLLVVCFFLKDFVMDYTFQNIREV